MLPDIGYLRLSQIIGDRKRGIPALIPVSRDTWYRGIREGRYPAGVKLGPRATGWSVASIKALMAEMAS